MEIDRRSFLLGLGTIAAGTAAASAVTAIPLRANAATKIKGLSILQGYTTETATQLTVDVDIEAKVSYSLTDIKTKKVLQPDSVKSVSYDGNSTRVDKIKFSSLELGHKYEFTVKEKKKTLDQRFLQACDLNNTNARVAVMSCMNTMFGDRDKIWAQAEKSNCDYYFFIGDAVYADLLWLYGPSYYWSRFVNTREDVPFYHWKNLKPVLSVWDDHDFGKNNSDGTYKYKDQAFHTYKAFFAQEPDNKNLYDGYANSFFFSAFGQNFAFFDSRYYRGLTNADGTSSFLGTDQINWMTKALKSRPDRPTLIMEGSPYYAGVEKGGSYSTVNAPELEYFMKQMKSLNAPCIFAGGDLHLTEISKMPKEILGYETYEIISSCMHSTKQKKFHSNPHEQVNGYLKQNFVVLQNIGLNGNAAWKTTCIGEDTVSFETVLKVG